MKEENSAVQANEQPELLIIEDEENLLTLLQKLFRLEDYRVLGAGSISEGRRLLKENPNIQVVVTDVMLPDQNGIEFTKEIKEESPQLEVIVLTALGNVKDGVLAMKLGAFDYITKGDGEEKLITVVAKAFEKARILKQVQAIKAPVGEQRFHKIIGRSPAILNMLELISKVAVTDTTVLVLGETGTGKELVAEAIHKNSKRKSGPFVAINCSAIPKDLQESELFGYKKGAFTGANKDKKGYFEDAKGGSVFLDELGEMSPDLQAKLLRALENRVINRVGDTQTIPIDVRIIAATNRNLISEKSDLEFRKDLYYRLSTFTIDLPPLNKRGDDIMLIAEHFINQISKEMQKPIKLMSDEFKSCLMGYSWPGNIRELRNVIERALILSDGDTLNFKDLPPEITYEPKSSDAENTYETKSTTVKTSSPNSNYPFNDMDLKTVEKIHISEVMSLVGGNKNEAAKLLNIGIATLYRKLKEYDIEY
ncbi:MAG: sigma-54 dependent transcriptional regulator [Cyclobacteriaceae bacterium]|nr:sigma-54-dependent Fis family transcriptional regulator [Cyclobacteriaceae bacterium]MCH8517616.1 sigma-54 dependent transcriptional regulator [Cyclobacteriaceae bacterium]